MSIKKKASIACLGTVLMFSMVGCSSNEEPEEPEKVVEKEKEKPIVNTQTDSEKNLNEKEEQAATSGTNTPEQSEETHDKTDTKNSIQSTHHTKNQTTQQTTKQNTSPQSCSIESAEDSYIVQDGDTLSKISHRFNIKIDELMNMNNLSSTTIYTCQELLLKQKDAKEETDEPSTDSTIGETTNNEEPPEEEVEEGSNDQMQENEQDEDEFEVVELPPEEKVDPFSFSINPFKITNENAKSAYMTGTGKPGDWVFLNEIQIDSLLSNQDSIPNQIYYNKDPWEQIQKVKVDENGKWSFEWTPYFTYKGFISGYVDALVTTKFSTGPTQNEEVLEHETIEFKIETEPEIIETAPPIGSSNSSFGIKPLKITSDDPTDAILRGTGKPGQWVFLNELSVYSPTEDYFHVDNTRWGWQLINKTKIDSKGYWKIDLSIILNHGTTEGIAEAKITTTPSSDESKFENYVTAIEIDAKAPKVTETLKPITVSSPNSVGNRNYVFSGTGTPGAWVFLKELSLSSGEGLRWFNPEFPMSTRQLRRTRVDENGHWSYDISELVDKEGWRNVEGDITFISAFSSIDDVMYEASTHFHIDN